jgi:hypothetical protein
LLPKLQHIRVAAAKLKNFHISPKLVNVWAYLFAAYNSDIFVRTVPSDQEIGNEIFYYINFLKKTCMPQLIIIIF